MSGKKFLNKLVEVQPKDYQLPTPYEEFRKSCAENVNGLIPELMSNVHLPGDPKAFRNIYKKVSGSLKHDEVYDLWKFDGIYNAFDSSIFDEVAAHEEVPYVSRLCNY